MEEEWSFGALREGKERFKAQRRLWSSAKPAVHCILDKCEARGKGCLKCQGQEAEESKLEGKVKRTGK